MDVIFRRLEPRSRYAILLCTLAARGDAQSVGRTLSLPDCDPKAGDYDNRTPLHVASEAGHLEVVKLLVEKGADVNAVDRWGCTPLRGAVAYNNNQIAQYLLEKGAKMNIAQVISGQTAEEMLAAVPARQVAVIRQIFDDLEPARDEPDTLSFGAVKKYLASKGFILSLHKQLTAEIASIFGPDADNDDTIPYIKFVEIMLGHETLLQRAFSNKLAIPDWEEFVEFVTETYKELKNVQTGERATYIPELGEQDPNWWGVSIVTVDGQVFNIGETDREFSIQSCGKPLLYSLVVEDHGYDHVHKYVGKEPSGREFNAFTLNYEGKPHNACINAGAIATAAMYHPELNSSGKYNKMTQGFSRLAGDQKVGFSQAVYLSEKETANRNFALTYFMASEGTFPSTNLEDSLDFYFQLCSVEINASKLAAIAATYAKYGTSPLTGERVLTFHTVKRTMQLCLTCGMYDYSGEWAYSTGLPAKSGVSGCVWFVVPSRVGICTFSPPLDEHGNSVRGIMFAQKIAAKYSWSVFDSVYRHREAQSIHSAPPTSDSEIDR